jgi:Zn-dependent protease with chaperone function
MSGFPIGHVAACLSAALLPGAALPRDHANVVDLSALRNKEEQVLTVGDRLAIAAAALCARQAPGLGIALHDLSQYGAAYRDAARPMFARAALPAVLAVAGEGAAARAGIKAGDAVIAVNGNPVPQAAGDGLARVETVTAAMQRAALSGSVRLTLARGDGAPSVRAFAPPPACAVRFQVRPDRELDARTDGWLIEITTGLADFVRGPDELAAVLAHELAHVILDHRAQVGRVSAAQSRSSELEADRLGIMLAARAGFRAAAAAGFWRRMRDRGPAGPSGLGRHPADRQRLKAVDAALRQLEEARPESRPAPREQRKP